MSQALAEAITRLRALGVKGKITVLCCPSDLEAVTKVLAAGAYNAEAVADERLGPDEAKLRHNPVSAPRTPSLAHARLPPPGPYWQQGYRKRRDR